MYYYSQKSALSAQMVRSAAVCEAPAAAGETSIGCSRVLRLVSDTAALLRLRPAFLAFLAAFTVSAAETTVSRQEWRFTTSAQTVGPDLANNVPTPARATIAPGEFAAGWLPQVPLANATGVWDLGRRGTVTIEGPPSSGPGVVRTIRVRVAQWIDGGLFREVADVAIPGATRSASDQHSCDTTPMGSWMEAVSEWQTPANVPTARIIVTSQNNGSVLDRIVVETEVPATSPPTLTLRRLATNHSQLSWPASATGYVLEQTDRLGDPLDWHVTPGTPQLSGGEWTLSVSANSAARFFRLRRP